jgi:aminoglycoside phosphotransferase (APT) family kinase protein
MARIHGVDPDPVADRVRSTAPSVAFALDELWPHLHAGAVAADRPDLARSLERLADTQPAPGTTVLCHGDLHPLNLLADGDRLTVLDWTAAIVAPPAYDVATTWFLLRHPPLPTPPALRPALGAGATVLARRFFRLYQRANPTADLRDLDWYKALVAARIVLDQATWTHTGDPRAHHHPWHLIAPAAARIVTRATRIDIQQP